MTARPKARKQAPPAEGAELCEKVTLTPNQVRVLPFLVAASSVVEACRAAKVTPKTVYGWLHDSPPFRDALRARRATLAAVAMDGLQDRIEQAITTLTTLLSAKTEGVRRAAARDILDLALRLRDTQEIEDRLTRLERQMEDRHVE